jgi:protein-disulfide isomerase
MGEGSGFNMDESSKDRGEAAQMAGIFEARSKSEKPRKVSRLIRWSACAMVGAVILSTAAGAPTGAPPPRARLTTPTSVYAIPVGSAPAKGPKTALVTIVAYMDFQCPFCRKAIKNLLTIQKAQPKDVRLVFKHRPLRFHRQAHIAAQAAVEAHKQKKFWAYQKLLWKNMRSLSPANLKKLGAKAKLNVKKLSKALSKKTHKGRVDKDNREALRFGVRGTPTMFFNGVKVVGARPLSSLQKTVKQQMARAKALLKKPGVTRKNIYAKLTAKGRKRAASSSGRRLGIKNDPRAGSHIPSGEIPAPKLATTSAKIKEDKVLTLSGSPRLGAARAPLTIVWFTSLNCYRARRMFRAWAYVSKRFRGKIKLVFKHHITSRSGLAFFAAMTAEEARDQGLFWVFIRQLLGGHVRNQKRVLEVAEQVGMDMKKLIKALKSKKHASRIKKDLAQAKGAIRSKSRCNVVKLPDGRELSGYISGYSLDYKLVAAEKVLANSGQLLPLP